jgi:hypothetical protein
MVTPRVGENDIPEGLKCHFAIFTCIMPDSAFIENLCSTY